VKPKANAKARPAAKPRPAAQAKATAKPAPKARRAAIGPVPASLRGAELVERVIATIEADGGVLGGCGIPNHKAEPLPAEILDSLTFPGGRPLPPSLRRFLQYDYSYLGVLEDPKAPRLAFRSFTEMMKQEFDARTADMYGEFEKILPGRCLVVPGGSDSRRFLYAGEPDAHGEYPVFVVDTDELPFVCLAYPGLDLYLADGAVTDILKGTYTDCFRHRGYKPALVDQARRNFGGFVSLDFQLADTEHVDGPEAAQAQGEKLFADLWGTG
jgi:hypothetical protein